MKRKHPQRSHRPSAPLGSERPPRREGHPSRPPGPRPPGPRPTGPGPRPAGHVKNREVQVNPESWIYGIHAALAAIANPTRVVRQITIAQESASDLTPKVAAARAARGSATPDPMHLPRADIERLLPRAAVHQGLAIAVADLPTVDMDDLIRAVDGKPNTRILVLDQVTDPHNVGAIMRSAAAFDVAAVVLPERNAPGASAVMAKAASGAMERVPLVRVVNLARALDQLKAANIWCIGLDGDATQSLLDSDLSGRIALVLGAEGEGLRRLTRERCDAHVRIPIAKSAVESLNVSNAAAIALYELARRR